MKNSITLSVLFVSFIILFGCKKSNEKLELPKFDYATTKDVNINLKYLSADNKPLKYVLVNFYYPGSKNSSDPVYKALTDSNGVLKGNFAAPAYKTAIIVDLKYPGISRNTGLLLQDNAINATFKAVAGTSTSSIHAKTLGVDSDGDGVEDAFDEFPNDVKRAYTKYYPSKNTWGTLVFEDNWPNKGDYDMNDLVVNYNYAIVCDYRGWYVEMDCNYKVLAAGATYSNGFGVNLPYTTLFTGGSPVIKSVTGQKLTENYVRLGPAGFDENGINIFPFDNHRSLFNGNTGMINTVKGSAKLVGDPVTVKLAFVNPASPTMYNGRYNTSRVGFTLWDVPFNPFLMRNMESKHEIHQIGYGPSSSAKPYIFSFYGAGDDASVPQLYSEFPSDLYRTKDGGKPWVLNFAEGFDYPTEYSSISKAYLHYDEWRAGLGYADWYLDKPGYRDSNLIYR
ncbi:MAG: LruC domain-containing protein [Pyrinomonadaceae bacterium]|nr:LruC domain-containing protein [Sphingobacteriaceae bacterium]